MEGKKQSISLRIDCHTIRLEVPIEQEEMYRKAAQTLNDTYQDYMRRYPDLTTDKLWVYTALTVAVNLHSDIREKDMGPVLERVAALNKRMEEAAKNEHTQR